MDKLSNIKIAKKLMETEQIKNIFSGLVKII